MRFACLSDTHGLHTRIRVPEADGVIHCGDFTKDSSKQHLFEFLQWYSSLPHKYKILVAGNHDTFVERASGLVKEICTNNGIVYLENNLTEIEGVKIYGSPATPEYGYWSFMYERGEEIAKIWKNIPENIDILVTHGPPLGIMDVAPGGVNAGCEELLKKVQEVRPKFHLFGHIHENSGKEEKNGTTFINCAIVNDRYMIVTEPFVFEV